MSDDKKALPTVEYILKSISWHLKTLVEEIKKLRESLALANASNINSDSF